MIEVCNHNNKYTTPRSTSLDDCQEDKMHNNMIVYDMSARSVETVYALSLDYLNAVRLIPSTERAETLAETGSVRPGRLVQGGPQYRMRYR